MGVSALAEQLKAVERRYAIPGATGAADYAKQLADWRLREAEREEVCSTHNATVGWLLLRLCARYGIRAYRRPRQKPTTISLQAPAGFVSKVLWPQVQAMAAVVEQARSAASSELMAAWLGPAGADEVFVLDDAPPPSG